MDRSCDLAVGGMIDHQVKNSSGNYYFERVFHRSIACTAHFHAGYELIYAEGGAVDVTVNGVEIPLSTGQMLLIAPYAVHTVRAVGTTTPIVVFSGDHIADRDARMCAALYGAFTPSADALAFLRQTLYAPQPPETLLLQACLYLVCHECLCRAPALSSGRDPVFVQRVTATLQQTQGDVSAAALARTLGYEYHYFSRLFHRNFAMRFAPFMQLYRFDRACRLLADPALTVTQVAGACGFGSVRNFDRVFASLAGRTPSGYRAHLRGDRAPAAPQERADREL